MLKLIMLIIGIRAQQNRVLMRSPRTSGTGQYIKNLISGILRIVERLGG
jgi:hypothetical protein